MLTIWPSKGGGGGGANNMALDWKLGEKFFFFNLGPISVSTELKGGNRNCIHKLQPNK